MTRAELKWDMVHCAIWALVCNPLPEDRKDKVYMADRKMIYENTANMMHSVDYEAVKKTYGNTRPVRRALEIAKQFYEMHVENNPDIERSPLWEPYKGWVATREGKRFVAEHEAKWRDAFVATSVEIKKVSKSKKSIQQSIS